MKYQLEYIHFHAGSQNQMDLTVMKAESVPLWVCHPSVIRFEKGFQGGKSAAVDKTRGGLLTQQCSRSVMFLVAPGSFAKDNLVHIPASELRACVGELP